MLCACQPSDESASRWQALPVDTLAQAPLDERFFGMHFHRPEHVPSADSFSVRTVRLWDAGVAWSEIQPQPDSFNFTKLDRWVRLAQKRHWELVYVFGRTPQWASARPEEYCIYGAGQAAEPEKPADWKAFVDTLAHRYQGQIRYWEIWNEPNYADPDSVWFFTGTPQTMAKMTQQAYQVLKQQDSGNQVLSPAAVAGDFDFTRQAGPQWFKAFFAAGGKEYFDILATHYYLKKGHNHPEKSVALMRAMDSLRQTFRIGHRPIWNTETGFLKPKEKPYEPPEAVATLAQAHLLAWVGGTARYYWYSYDNRGFVTLYLTQKNRRTPTAAAIAHQRLKKWLTGFRVKDYALRGDSTRKIALEKAGKKKVLYWHPRKNVEVAVSQEFSQATNLMGERLEWQGRDSLKVGPVPVLVE